MASSPQPVLILGGFLITQEAYAPMVETLSRLTGQPVRLLEVSRLEWLLTVFPFAWARILDRVASLATELAQTSPTGRITLVGHSSGGILLRLFLSDLPFQGRRYGGRRLAPTAYRNSTGNANDRGDGLVPVSGALLSGSRPIVLEGVAHGGAFGPKWYGSPEVVERWWTLQSAPTA
jgi:hypothetical protein